jgi:hypothetical protein
VYKQTLPIASAMRREKCHQHGTCIRWLFLCNIGSCFKSDAIRISFRCVYVVSSKRLSPIDAKASGLKRPSEVLKKFLQGALGMPKKPLSAVRDIKKAPKCGSQGGPLTGSAVGQPRQS